MKINIFERHPIITQLISSIAALAILLFCLEVGYRLVRGIVRSSSLQKSTVVSDKKLGWTLDTEMKKSFFLNKCGEQTIISPYRHRLIVKFPKYKNKRTILFIGDSSTQVASVSTGRAYYDIFEELVKNSFSVYAAGVGGYGNLQEYLMLNEIYDEIKPDIVLWQHDNNDISNNVYELDNSSFYNNQRPRPYLNLNNDSIEMKDPGFPLFDISHGFRFLFYKILILDRKYNLGILRYLDSLIELDEETRTRKHKEGLEVLSRVLKLSMRNYPHTKFIGFCLGSDDGFKNIFESNGAIYFNQFGSKIYSIEGTNCKPLDSHLNHKGNRLAGELMYNFFKQNDLFNSE
ncbi:MAG: SGNH/GDSL hydrolase family protein [Bacteroidetes bacterium]|nr:SGNH/GDSL hydrolase family protein [Bacteroidota bacterium]